MLLLNHNNLVNLNYQLFSSRFCFEVAAKGPERQTNKPEKPTREKFAPDIQKRIDAAIKEGVKQGLAKAQAEAAKKQPAAKRPESAPPAKPEKPEIPKVPDQFKGFRFDQKKSRLDQQTQTIQQPFQFGDERIKGTVIYPQKPDSKAKTTYVFNYVDNPDKIKPEEQKKLLKSLADKKEKLGNCVVINIKTPSGEVKIDGQKIEPLQRLMGNLEKLQQDHPVLKGQLPRPEAVLHLANQNEAGKVAKIVKKLQESNKDQTDQRLTKCKAVLKAEPDQFVKSLDEAIQELEKPEAMAKANKGQGATAEKPAIRQEMVGSSRRTTRTPKSAPSARSTASGQEAQAAKEMPRPGPEKPRETKEEEQQLAGKVLVIGDSLLAGSKKYLQAEKIIDKFKDGKNTVQQSKRVLDGTSGNPSMLSIMENLKKEYDKNPANKPDKLLILGGTNDLTADKEKVLQGLQNIWAMAKQLDIKVYACTIPPINRNGKYFRNNYDQANQNRKFINEEILKLEGQTNGPDQVVKLHLPLSEGGLADEKSSNDQNDQHLDRLHPDYGAKDGLHPSAKGQIKMAEQIQRKIGKGNKEQREAMIQTANAEVIKTKLDNNKIDTLINFPKPIQPDLPTEVVIYATANGSNPERAQGKGDLLGVQANLVREKGDKNFVMVYITPPNQRWSSYNNKNSAKIISEIKQIVANKGIENATYSIDGCSGGGSYQFDVINKNAEIPDDIAQFTFFDSIYGGFTNSEITKLKKWLDRDANHKLVLLSGSLIQNQKNLMKNLEKLGIQFEETAENSPHKTYKGMNGQICLVEMRRSDHGTTIDNGFRYAHTLNNSGKSLFAVSSQNKDNRTQLEAMMA